MSTSRPSTKPRSSLERILDSALVQRVVWNVIPASLIVGIVGLAVLGDEGLLERHALKQRLHHTEEQVTRLATENDLLRAEIHRMRHDPLVVRRSVAENLYLAEEGATIYRFPDEPPAP